MRMTRYALRSTLWGLVTRSLSARPSYGGSNLCPEPTWNRFRVNHAAVQFQHIRRNVYFYTDGTFCPFPVKQNGYLYRSVMTRGCFDSRRKTQRRRWPGPGRGCAYRDWSAPGKQVATNDVVRDRNSWATSTPSRRMGTSAGMQNDASAVR